jgi:hypothetical protein
MKKAEVGTGQKAPESGIYKFSGRDTEVALSKGDTVPPNTEGHLQKVILIRKTKR